LGKWLPGEGNIIPEDVQCVIQEYEEIIMKIIPPFATWTPLPLLQSFLFTCHQVFYS